MHRHILPALGATLLILAAAQAAFLIGNPARLFAFAEPGELLKGCSDVPEAVALADTLHQRALRIERFLQEMDRKKAEIAEAQTQLTEKLVELRNQRTAAANVPTPDGKAVADDAARLVALYDQMKPEQAASVISNLPPDFAAEILMRLQPENGARILASVEPGQAAVLTSYMGARSAVRK